MRILWTLPYLPWPTTSGAKNRQYHLLRSLAGQGHRITLLVQSKTPLNEDARQALAPLVDRLIVLHRRPLRSPQTLLAALYAPYPVRASIHGLAPHLRHRFEQLLSESWDVIQIEHSYSFQPFERALQQSGQPFILTEHRVESEQGAGRQDSLPLWLQPFTAFDLWRYRRWESRVLGQATEVIAVCPRDAEHISTITGRRTSVVVNGVDSEHFSAINPALHSQRLLFVGNFEHRANFDAIEWALEEILPQVWASYPAVRFAICGNAMPQHWKLRWDDPRIEWHGYVEDLRELQRHSAIFFAPLRQGGGSKIKVLEAMAAGLPVVTTTQGVCGLNVENDVHYIGRDDADDLALTLIQLLTQPCRMKKMADAARQYVSREHDWRVAAAQLKNVYARFTSARVPQEVPENDRFSHSAE
ncbi:glycosyltransferase family 4 protein [Pseudomonas sp. R5(2019)]|uniref:glycosyltransferase family 4 protein n=1 Tax=Pseudomonas sp. R5(2019) TaxID=2697566 RepID=UPI00141283C8|nr:glycosyltransferase family 4 protein [Pseudomonas sp. R5(2019)]NBA93812.1 glycosyltransferase [Pseudomonas sp. R5(2019)]